MMTLYGAFDSVRREILKLDEKKESFETGASVLIDELPEETQMPNGDSDDFSEANEKQKARNVILQGAIPRIIYSNAIAAIPDDIAFRLKFIEISDLFGHKFASDLSQFILEACLKDFADSELVHAVKALRPFIVETNALHAEKLAIQSFEESIASLDTVLMQEKFAEWIVDRLAASSSKSAQLVDYATKKLKQLAYESSAISIKYVDFVQRTEGTLKAIDVVKFILSKHHSRSAPLWLLYSQLVLQQAGEDASTTSEAKPHPVKRRRTSTDNKIAGLTSSHNPNPVSEAIAILEDAAASELERDDYDGKYAVFRRLLQLLIGNSTSSAQEIHQTFQVRKKHPHAGACLMHFFLPKMTPLAHAFTCCFAPPERHGGATTWFGPVECFAPAARRMDLQCVLGRESAPPV